MDDPSLAAASGWLALALVLATGLVPLAYRWRHGKRAQPGSPTVSLHVTVGVGVGLCAFLHALFALLSLGSPGAIGAGDLALFAGAGALMVLLAHVGIGLQLRNPTLRKRNETRRRHLFTASTITVLALVHVWMLWSAGD